MRRSVFAINDFAHLTGASLAAFGLNVGTKMTGNANFPDPPVAATAITSAANMLLGKITAAAGGDIVAVAQMHQAEKDLIGLLKQDTRYINTTTYDNQVAIDSSGFTSSTDETTPGTITAQPVVKAMQSADPGAATINIMGARGAKAYIVALYPADVAMPTVTGSGFRFGDDAHGVIILADTHPNITVTGLPAMTRYYTVCIAVNAAGVSPMSNPVDVVAK